MTAYNVSAGTGVYIGGTFLNSQTSSRLDLDAVQLRGQSSSAEIITSSGGIFQLVESTFVFTTNPSIYSELRPSVTSGYSVYEGYNALGAIFGSGNSTGNAGSVILAPNRVQTVTVQPTGETDLFVTSDTIALVLKSSNTNTSDIQDWLLGTSTVARMSKAGKFQVETDSSDVLSLTVVAQSTTSAPELDMRTGPGAIIHTAIAYDPILGRSAFHNSTSVSGFYAYDSGSIGIGQGLLGTTLAQLQVYKTGNGPAAIVAPQAATDKGLVIIGTTSQSANLTEWQKAGVVVSSVDLNGNIHGATFYATNLVDPSNTINFLSTNLDGTHGFASTSRIATYVPFTVKGAAAQTANLQEWQNSSGVIVGTMSSAGTLNIASGTITTFTASTITAPSILSVSTNSLPCSTCIGFSTSSAITNVSAGSSGAWADITSITLTPGVWSVQGQVDFTAASVASTEVFMGIGLAGGNDATGLTLGDTEHEAAPPTSTYNTSASVIPFVKAVNTNTTMYLKHKQAYSGTAPQDSGRITAILIH